VLNRRSGDAEAIYRLAFQEVRASSALSLPTMNYAWRVEPTGKQSKNIPIG
jgi:hypothetical protein